MATKYKVLIVGAFPPPGTLVFGGILSSCGLLVPSIFSEYYNLILIDSTQRCNPPESLISRGMLAALRLFKFIINIVFEKPDAVILFTSLGLSLVEKGLMAWVGRLIKIPVLMFPRAGGIIAKAENCRFHRMWILIALKGATHILCQGPTMHRFSLEVVRFPLNRLAIIENWTATDALLKIGELRSEKKSSETLVLLFLGWLEESKGIFELLEVVNSLSRSKSFKLAIAGRGAAEERARLYVEANRLAKHVEFVGWVDEENKMKLLARADILILPSWEEGFPNAIIEAMAAKLAVIVSKVGNVPELITSYDQAILVPPKDVYALEFALDDLLSNSLTRTELADRGYRFCKATFSTRQGISKLISAIDSAINKGER